MAVGRAALLIESVTKCKEDSASRGVAMTQVRLITLYVLVIPSEDKIMLELLHQWSIICLSACTYNLSVRGSLLNFNPAFSKYLRNSAGRRGTQKERNEQWKVKISTMEIGNGNLFVTSLCSRDSLFTRVTRAIDIIHC